MMRRVALTLGMVFSVGCSSDSQPTPQPDAAPADTAVTADRGADGVGDLSVADAAPTALQLGFAAPTNDTLPIGQHQVLQGTVSGNGSLTVSLQAPPCLLKVPGAEHQPGAVINAAVTAGTPRELVVFAPIDAPPGETCTVALATPEPRLTLEPTSFTVAEPTFTLITLDDHSVTGIEGLKATKIGVLQAATRRVRALTYAGGIFGGAWFAVSADDSDDIERSASTVRIYRFDTQVVGAIPAWLDLEGQVAHPMVVEDLVWAPIGPCNPQSDALYLVADDSDPALVDDPEFPADQSGGIYCIDVNGQVAQIYDDRGVQLDVDLIGGFFSGAARGGLYVYRYSDLYYYPDGAQVPDIGQPTRADHMRLAREGPLAGHMYLVPHPPEGGPTALIRIAPEGAEWKWLADVYDGDGGEATDAPTLSYGGPFGRSVLIPARGVTNRTFDILALIEDSDPPRQLRLVNALSCGDRLAIDDQGLRLAVTTSSGSCSGSWTAYLFEFDLP